MGAAIGVFAGAQAIEVPRTRFAPVKTTDDLLAVRSDAYVLTEDYRVMANPAASHLRHVVVILDPRHYRLIDEMEARFPYGPPVTAAVRKAGRSGRHTFRQERRLEGRRRPDQ